MPAKDHPILKKMRSDWNARAKDDAEYFIASSCESDPQAFRASGKRDVKTDQGDCNQLRVHVMRFGSAPTAE